MDTKAADDGHVNATTKDGSGRSNSVERNNFPDFCKLERVQDILDRNKYVYAWVEWPRVICHDVEQTNKWGIVLILCVQEIASSCQVES